MLARKEFFSELMTEMASLSRMASAPERNIWPDRPTELINRKNSLSQMVATTFCNAISFLVCLYSRQYCLDGASGVHGI